MDKNSPLALIIEDDDGLAFIFEQALSEAAFETTHAKDGLVALDRLKTITPALILLDLHLPHVSGKEVLEAIRSDDRLKDTCVMVSSADPLMAETLRNLASHILIKPVGFTQLRDLAARYHPSNRHSSA